jgi:AAA ATPase domain
MPYVGGAGLDTQKLCLEGTRREILDDITDWINNTEDHTSPIFWLHGNAGTGKSSIAHTIAYRFNMLGRLGSCYCFDRSKIAEERDKKIFTTIAQDLADSDEQIRRELAAVVHLDKSLRNTTDILQQWKELIMKPADKLSEAMVGPVVIVIDALDESGEAASRQPLLSILAGKLYDGQSHISKLPPHFRILLTSRALPDICDALNGVKHVQSKSMDTILPMLTERDIFHYISEELRGILIDDVSRRLASSSGGLFEWARLACAYIKQTIVGMTPMELFNAIITTNKADRVNLLESMYKLTLDRIFPSDPKMRDLSLHRFKSVMAQILGIAEPLPLNALTSMRSHFIEASLREIDVGTIVKPMGALLSGTTEPSAMIRPLHASFPEFLTDKSQSGEFFVDLSQIHNDLVAASLGVMKDELEFNICQLPSSYLSNSEIPDFDHLVKKRISPELSYSCRFWTDHLRRAQFNAVLADAIRELFNHERLLFWIEILSLLKTINTCAGSMSFVIQWVVVCAMAIRV